MTTMARQLSDDRDLLVKINGVQFVTTDERLAAYARLARKEAGL